MFIQPFVFRDQDPLEEVRLDDIIGSDNFALVAWGTNPTWGLSPTQVAARKRLRTTFIQVVPACQLKIPQSAEEQEDGFVRVGDSRNADIKKWFSSYPCSIAVIRPDRIVGAVAIPQTLGDISELFFEAIGLAPVQQPLE